VSALARLLFYAATSLAIPVLRRKMPPGEGERERPFTLPGGPSIPLLAAALCVWLIVGSSLSQVLMLAAAAALGTVLYYAGSRATSARS